MAITKMKAVTISGQIEDFDSVVEKYIYGRDIHLEKAISVLSNRKNLQSFEDTDEYETIGRDALDLIKLAGNEVDGDAACVEDTPDEMRAFLNSVSDRVESERQRSEELGALIEANSAVIEQIELMLSVNVDLSKLNDMEFIKYRFGHIPKTSYKTLTTYLDSLEAIFVKTADDLTDVWGFCFMPASVENKIDEVFGSLYFEAVNIPAGYTGTPLEIKLTLIKQNEEYKREIENISEKTSQILSNSVSRLRGIYNIAKKRHQFAQIRQNAVKSDVFFYVVGWMSAKDAAKLEKEISSSGDMVMFYSGEPSEMRDIEPPTKLKNNPVFRPFEMFVKMYGLPSYGEIDPTPILAITYILFFGIMFGDVGQAAVLSIIGFILYKVKKMDLAGIVGIVGISGIVFGFIYGSVFGNEEIIPHLLHTLPLRPMEQIMLMLGGTVGIGVITIIFGMALNVYNSFKEKSYGEAIFGHNGIAGLVFYISLLLLAGNIFLKWGVPNAVFAWLITVSLLAMYLAEPLGKLTQGKKDWKPKGAMFFVENFFELFEVLLSFLTNTISFLRIGAFAIIHVGMMTAVALLSRGGGVGGIVVQVFGNVLVMVLEGLIVGIQVLRLEYYEMFSRYFSGKGKEFVSLRDKEQRI